MSFDVSALAAYIENQDFPLVANLQISSDTAMLATKQTGIKGSSKLHFLSSDVTFQTNDCSARSASGTTTLTDKTLTVGDVAIRENLCPKTLIGKWAQIELQIGSQGDKVMPEAVASVYMAEKMAQIQEAIEDADWNGDTALTSGNRSFYDGWIKYIDAGSPVAGNTGSITSGTGITTANVLTALHAMFLAMPKELQAKSGKSLFVPRAWYNAYTIAGVNGNFYNYQFADEETQLLIGTDVVLRPTDALSNRMFLTYNENLVIGMDGDADEDNMMVRLDPVSEKNIFYDVEFKRGTQVQFTELVVQFTFA